MHKDITKNILIVTTEYAHEKCNAHCGAGFYITRMAKALHRSGYALNIVTLVKKGENPFVLKGNPTLYAESDNLSMSKRLRALFNSNKKIDLIIRNDYIPGMSPTTEITNRKCRVIQVIHHGFEHYLPGFSLPEKKKGKRVLFFNLICNSADRVITVSSWMAKQVLRRDFGFNGKVDIVSGGFSWNRIRRGKHIIFQARLDTQARVEQKGLACALEAIKILKKDFKQSVTLILAGPIAAKRGKNRIDHAILLQMADEKGLKDDVEIIDRYANPLEIAACTLGILPSTVESFGMTALDFLASGKPVVTTDIGGFRDIVPKKYQVPVNSPRKLAEKINELIDSFECGKLGKLVKNTQGEIQKNYSFEARAKRFIEVIEDVCALGMSRQVYLENSEEYKILSTQNFLKEHENLK
jgi:glycosyltransferase involved in cell wall biosynthesis